MPSRTEAPLLLDTHCLVWLVEGTPGVLSTSARELIRAGSSGPGLCVSVISFWEIALLVSKGRLRLSRPIDSWVAQTIERLDPTVVELSLDIALESTRLPDLAHADPADRFLLATARVHNLAFLTKDRVLLDYGREGYVRVVSA